MFVRDCLFKHLLVIAVLLLVNNINITKSCLFFFLAQVAYSLNNTKIKVNLFSWQFNLYLWTELTFLSNDVTHLKPFPIIHLLSNVWCVSTDGKLYGSSQSKPPSLHPKWHEAGTDNRSAHVHVQVRYVDIWLPVDCWELKACQWVSFTPPQNKILCYVIDLHLYLYIFREAAVITGWFKGVWLSTIDWKIHTQYQHWNDDQERKLQPTLSKITDEAKYNTAS